MDVIDHGDRRRWPGYRFFGSMGAIAICRLSDWGGMDGFRDPQMKNLGGLGGLVSRRKRDQALFGAVAGLEGAIINGGVVIAGSVWTPDSQRTTGTVPPVGYRWADPQAVTSGSMKPGAVAE